MNAQRSDSLALSTAASAGLSPVRGGVKARRFIAGLRGSSDSGSPVGTADESATGLRVRRPVPPAHSTGLRVHRPVPPRRAVILPVVLVVLLILGIMVAGYSFRVHADLSALQAGTNRMQTRMAAEAGIEKVKLMLRLHRFDMDVWYNNPDELHRILVWGMDEDAASIGTDEEFGDGSAAFRFTIIADDFSDDEDFCRFGLTDEASKLNLNNATEAQLLQLVEAAVGEENEEINPQHIVDAILDWRDADRAARGEQTDTEGAYYEQLSTPYKVKNGPFDTVEELLLVKGVTPQVLYGEDFDRNGLRTDNEDDGDESFPMDNEDGRLNLGLYPYLTTISYENNVANDNRPRINLLGGGDELRKELALLFPDEPDVAEYIATTAPTLFSTGGGNSKGGGGNRPGGATGKPTGDTGQPEAGTPAGGEAAQPGPTSTNPRGGRRNDRGNPPPVDDKTGGDGGKQPADGGDPKSGVRSQVKDPGGDKPEENPEDSPVKGEKEGDGEVAEDGKPVEGRESDQPEEGAGDPAKNPAGGAVAAGGAGTPRPKTPAALFVPPVGDDGTPQPTPLRVEDHLAILMDKTTVLPPQQREIKGLININTAPPAVLRTIPELTPELVGAIVEARSQLDAETKKTTAWLVTEGVMELDAYVRVAPGITARAQQFTVESLGYADHIGMVTRLQVVLDTVGPLAQTIYYRDISHLGATFPIREEDKEKIRVP